MTTKDVSNVVTERFAEQMADLTGKSLSILRAMTAQRIAQQTDTPEFRELSRQNPAEALRRLGELYTDSRGKCHLFDYMGR